MQTKTKVPETTASKILIELNHSSVTVSTVNELLSAII